MAYNYNITVPCVSTVLKSHNIENTCVVIIITIMLTIFTGSGLV